MLNGKTKFYTPITFGNFKCLLMPSGDKDPTFTIKGAKPQIDGIGIYSIPNSTSNVTRWKIAEGDWAGMIFTRYHSDVDFENQTAGICAMALKELELPNNTVAEDIYRALLKKPVTLCHFQEYSADRDQIFEKWAAVRSASAVADDATIFSVRAALKAEAEAEAAEKALLATGSTLPDGEL